MYTCLFRIGDKKDAKKIVGEEKWGISFSMFCKECKGVNYNNVEVLDVSDKKKTHRLNCEFLFNL